METNKEIVTTEHSHDVSIALIQKDMEYVRKSIENIETTIKVYDAHFARKEEVSAILKLIEKLDTETKLILSKKVDHSDFDPIKRTLYRINWLLIAAVVGALLALLIKK